MLTRLKRPPTKKRQAPQPPERNPPHTLPQKLPNAHTSPQQPLNSNTTPSQSLLPTPESSPRGNSNPDKSIQNPFLTPSPSQQAPQQTIQRNTKMFLPKATRHYKKPTDLQNTVHSNRPFAKLENKKNTYENISLQKWQENIERQINELRYCIHITSNQVFSSFQYLTEMIHKNIQAQKINRNPSRPFYKPQTRQTYSPNKLSIHRHPSEAKPQTLNPQNEVPESSMKNTKTPLTSKQNDVNDNFRNSTKTQFETSLNDIKQVLQSIEVGLIKTPTKDSENDNYSKVRNTLHDLTNQVNQLETENIKDLNKRKKKTIQKIRKMNNKLRENFKQTETRSDTDSGIDKSGKYSPTTFYTVTLNEQISNQRTQDSQIDSQTDSFKDNDKDTDKDKEELQKIRRKQNVNQLDAIEDHMTDYPLDDELEDSERLEIIACLMNAVIKVNAFGDPYIEAMKNHHLQVLRTDQRDIEKRIRKQLENND